MGYQRSTLMLRFDPSTDFAGLEVEMKRMTVDQTVDVAGLADNRPGRGTPIEELRLYLKRVQDQIAEGLISWNYEDHTGQPVEATAEGVSTVDLDMLLAILMAWLDVAVTPSAPLEQSLNDGPPSPAALAIPMDVQLPPQPS